MGSEQKNVERHEISGLTQGLRQRQHSAQNNKRDPQDLRVKSRIQPEHNKKCLIRLRRFVNIFFKKEIFHDSFLGVNDNSNYYLILKRLYLNK